MYIFRPLQVVSVRVRECIHVSLLSQGWLRSAFFSKTFFLYLDDTRRSICGINIWLFGKIINNVDRVHLRNSNTHVLSGNILHSIRIRVMVFSATCNNVSVISWRSFLLVEETGVHWENHRPAASHWQTLSHNFVSSTPRHERDSNSQR